MNFVDSIFINECLPGKAFICDILVVVRACACVSFKRQKFILTFVVLRYCDVLSRFCRPSENILLYNQERNTGKIKIKDSTPDFIVSVVRCLVICRYHADQARVTKQRCHNERHGVSNHQPHDYLLNRLFRSRSKKTSKLRVTGLCVGNSPMIGEFPAQRDSNAESVSIWWRHHFKVTISNSTRYSYT